MVVPVEPAPAGQPLSGLRVVVTRPRAQAGGLVERLRALGADTVEIPAIVIGPPADGGAALAQAASDLAAGRYGTVVLTSANGVERLLAEIDDVRAFERARVAAVGRSTGAALARHGVAVDVVPGEYVAESLLEALGEPPAPQERRVLLARAAVARDILPDGLRAAGWEVDVVEAYRTGPGTAADTELDRAAAAGAICFTSSSTVENYLTMTGSRPVPRLVVCIGPVTAATARAHGLTVAAVAELHTVDGLVEALLAAASR
jgi:uroporphyrinogen-III synthase